MERKLWTIGHWTCPIPDFMEPLKEHEIDVLVDVRAHPGSRRNPQFGQDAMAEWLPEHGVRYQRMEKLGGRRRKQKDVDPDVNAGWENASFKNYADYTLTEDFREGLKELEALASENNVAIMCGEPMPWRCHRLLVSNVLVSRDWDVWHLMTNGKPKQHVLGQWGATPTKDSEGHLIYPPA